MSQLRENIQRQHGNLYACDPDAVRVADTGSRSFVAAGCGTRAAYICQGDGACEQHGQPVTEQEVMTRSHEGSGLSTASSDSREPEGEGTRSPPRRVVYAPEAARSEITPAGNPRAQMIMGPADIVAERRGDRILLSVQIHPHAPVVGHCTPTLSLTNAAETIEVPTTQVRGRSAAYEVTAEVWSRFAAQPPLTFSVCGVDMRAGRSAIRAIRATLPPAE